MKPEAPHFCFTSMTRAHLHSQDASECLYVYVSHLLMARARFSISEFCCLISLVKFRMTFSNWWISLGSVRLMFWYNIAACSFLEDIQDGKSALFFCTCDTVIWYDLSYTRIIYSSFYGVYVSIYSPANNDTVAPGLRLTKLFLKMIP